MIGSQLLGLTAKLITLECQRSASSQVECQRSVAGILGTEKEQIPGFVTSAKTVKTSEKG
ncbi:hypothetical protein [Chamaesiphon minutus]|uniref:hypothetical protein n=1 Tax=Chamaesiphon minutus TaxID=1173032 RepID=UPI0005A0B775|nr:hypothetical protein [Chamaesiphon minutus]